MSLAGQRDTFAALLRGHRRELGWTQEELAERAGISAEAISSLERGTRLSPRIDTVRRLQDALALGESERVTFFQAARSVQKRARPAGVAVTPAPLPAADVSSPVTLPYEPTVFIGREREQADIVKRLVDARLLTLTGPGGVGKTRLAVAVARTVAGSFPDGVYFVDLAPLTDPRHIASAIAQVLNVKPASNQPIEVAVLDHLEARRSLIVLDNFEHLLSGANLVVRLLERCRALTVLVTSRAPLRLRAEHRYVVPPLSLPIMRSDSTRDDPLRSDAVALFLERVRAHGSECDTSPEALATVGRICEELDGLPLAIELVAARAAVLTPPVLLQRLAHRLPMLTDGPRDSPERHRSLRSVIQWSYALLPADESALFARLAVFAGGCTVTSAEAVCGDETPDHFDVLNGILALVNHSLVKRVDGSEVGPRFTMLATIREYAWELLADTGELEGLQRRHVEHYTSLAETIAARIEGPDGSRALAQLGAEADNMRAALTWALSPDGDVDVGLRLAAALLPYWLVLGLFREGREWLTPLLSRAVAGPPLARARALHASGVLARELAEGNDARALLEEALSLYRTAGDNAGIAAVLHALSYDAIADSDYPRAIARLEEALTRRRALGDLAGVAETHGALSSMYIIQNEDRRAVAHLEEALALRRKLGDAWGITVALATLAMTLVGMGELDRAQTYAEEALPLQARLGNSTGVALSTYVLAQIARKQGAAKLAMARCAEALTVWHDLGSTLQVALALEEMVTILCMTGGHATGATLLGCLERFLTDSGFPLPPRYRRVHDDNRQAVRAGLDSEAYLVAHQRGCTMSLDDAVEFVLDQAMDRRVERSRGV